MKKKFPAVSLILLFLLIAETTVASLFLSSYDTAMGMICFVSAIVTALMFIAEMFLLSRNTIRHITRMSEHLESSTAEYINSLPSPVAVIDSEKKIIWYNTAFSEKISPERNLYGMSIENIANLNYDSIIADGSGLCTINGSTYRVSCEKSENDSISFNFLCFHDETEYISLKRKFDETHPNVVVITVDNYDEILQNAKESEKSQASVEVEKLIENFMSSTNGFVRKSGSNTFYAVIEKRHIDEIIFGKFKILDLARDIKIAGKYPLTFSIGVGLGAESLADSEKIAKQCLDMALGRGGDQAVIKTENGYQFFGGVSKGMEKKSRAKTRIIANALQDISMNSAKG
ncbi:MAG: RNA/single-stranded DNA exonuclease, partial [Ruminococcus sp.]|nr:RNA/single-stranded DNA exonuclease [Ruminococcus sp.]